MQESTARKFHQGTLGALLLTTGLVGPILAQSPDLVTDRPDQTESASVVPRGWGQIEVGWTFEHDSEPGVEVETFEAPATLLRLGLLDRVELRIGWTGYVRQAVDIAGFGRRTLDGLGDMDLGAKVLLAEGRDHRPRLALIVASTIPVGSGEVTSDSYDPSFRFNLDHDLSERMGLGVNLGAEWQDVPGPSGGGETASSFVYTAVVGWDLGDEWGAFVEVFGSEHLSGPDVPSETSLDGGVTWLLRPNLQLDLAGGVGLADTSADRFVGMGVSYRWPS